MRHDEQVLDALEVLGSATTEEVRRHIIRQGHRLNKAVTSRTLTGLERWGMVTALGYVETGVGRSSATRWRLTA